MKPIRILSFGPIDRPQLIELRFAAAIVMPAAAIPVLEMNSRRVVSLFFLLFISEVNFN